MHAHHYITSLDFFIVCLRGLMKVKCMACHIIVELLPVVINSSAFKTCMQLNGIGGMTNACLSCYWEFPDFNVSSAYAQ